MVCFSANLVSNDIVFSQSCPKNEDSTKLDEKIYIDTDQICITEFGIIVLIDSQDIRVTSIHFDEGGFFIETKEFDPNFTAICPNGHPQTCVPCGGCNRSNYHCPYRCKCLG